MRGRHRCLVIGGARSGKSTWAERRLAELQVRYLATGYPVGQDEEWRLRVARHRDRRPAGWVTLETLEIAEELRRDDPRPLLVDCLTLWLTRVLDQVDGFNAAPGQARHRIGPRIDALLDGLAQTSAYCLLVSNEVGSGVVADSPSGRLFADLLGELNSAVAAACDEVVLTVAGIPVQVKGGPPPWATR
jgi:adenosylcobinamide kinase/adenosylcobinamide-phosphate guanylyltransferase